MLTRVAAKPFGHSLDRLPAGVEERRQAAQGS